MRRSAHRRPPVQRYCFRDCHMKTYDYWANLSISLIFPLAPTLLRVEKSLSAFLSLPPLPQENNAGLTEAVIDLLPAALYRPFYFDPHWIEPSCQGSDQFEHASSLILNDEVRFQEDGVGASTKATRSKPGKIVQVCFRWPLHEHLGIEYFVNLKSLVGMPTPELVLFSKAFNARRQLRLSVRRWACLNHGG